MLFREEILQSHTGNVRCNILILVCQQNINLPVYVHTNKHRPNQSFLNPSLKMLDAPFKKASVSRSPIAAISVKVCAPKKASLAAAL